MRQQLHLIEPTLANYAGHEYGYVTSLITSNTQFDIHLWLATRASSLSIANCTLHNFFYRKVRHLQKWWLYYKLLKQKQCFYVCTSGIIDLIICHVLAKFFKLSTKTANFHFHQFNATAKKLNKLAKISKSQGNNFKIFATTESLINIFKKNGFTCCQAVSCPTAIVQLTATENFHKVLYAGVARADKGFPLVVDVVAKCIEQNIDIPWELQINPPNSNRLDKASSEALAKLEKLPQQNIVLHRQALASGDFYKLFYGAICLLLYEQKQYSDKFSGVALDALSARAPIITVAGTWMADVVNRFRAGMVLQKATMEKVQEAIFVIKNNYASYHNSAKLAADFLRELHSPTHTLQAIYQQNADLLHQRI